MAMTKDQRDRHNAARRHRYHNDPEYRSRCTENQRKYQRKRYQEDPEFRKRAIEANDRSFKKAMTDPEKRANRNKIVKESKKRWHRRKIATDPEFREKRNKYAREYYHRRKNKVEANKRAGRESRP